MIYLVKYRPFEDSIINIINVYNEAILFVSYAVIIFFTMVSIDKSKIEIVGWVLLGFISISFLLTWYLIISGIKRSCMLANSGNAELSEGKPPKQPNMKNTPKKGKPDILPDDKNNCDFKASTLANEDNLNRHFKLPENYKGRNVFSESNRNGLI